MRADDILAQIDDTLDDWTVSGDAMRSRPGGKEGGIKGFTTQFAITDEVTEWQIDPEFQQRLQELQGYLARTAAEQTRRAQQVMEAFTRSLEAARPRVEEAGQAIAKYAEIIEEITPPLPPGRRRDRPAWQSPYGPPRRRR
ncbi:hypothetical protein [Streptomyces sp. enrichment culture]|uniref:hypothetical protein n=1 Tax=Streptomyces sp. enrichment culture TaxID=1795815 RepID=UPI003F570145